MRIRRRTFHQLPAAHFHFVPCHVASGRPAAESRGCSVCGSNGQGVAGFPLAGGVGPAVTVEEPCGIFRVYFVVLLRHIQFKLFNRQAVRFAVQPFIRRPVPVQI